MGAFITLCVGALGLWGVSKLNTHLTEVGQVRLPSLQGLDLMYEGLLMHRFVNRGMLDPQLEDATADKLIATGKQADELCLKGYAIYEPLPQTKEEAEIWNRFVPLWKAFLARQKEMEAIQANHRKQPSAEEFAALRRFTVTTMSESTLPVQSLLEKLSQIQMDVAEVEKQAAAKESAQIRLLSIILCAGGTLLSIGLGIFIARAITRPILRLTADLEAGAGQIASASNQVASSGQTLAVGASDQASNLEETSASLEQIGGMTRKNRESAEAAKSLSSETRAAAGDCGVRTAEMAAATRAITQAVDKMGAAIAGIEHAGEDVTKILKTIDEIAFQTNILALNAAVEAARAGESGAGFAVVAEEVRALAQRSAAAAKETARLVEQSQTQTRIGVEATRRVEECIGEISRKSDAVRESLTSIAEKAGRVDALVGEVTTASKEQAEGVAQINQAMEKLDRVTQENAAASEESASAAEELSSQSDEMRQIVHHLNHLVLGGAAGEAAARKAAPAAPRPAKASPASTPALRVPARRSESSGAFRGEN